MTTDINLFDKYTLGNIDLKNRIVMAPLTRSRAIDNVPNELMAKYFREEKMGIYGQNNRIFFEAVVALKRWQLVNGAQRLGCHGGREILYWK